MSLKHAILGFLSFKSLSGYDLKKAFDHSVQHFWPANQSQIYRTLAQMKDEGSVDLEVIERDDRLDLKIYHITAKGSTELHDWLSTPLPPTDYREPFLIQVYFGGVLTDAELIRVLQNEIQDTEKKLAEFNAVYQMYQEMLESQEDPRAYFLSVLTMEFGIRNGLASLNWLKSVVERVQSGDYELEDFHLE